MDPLHTSEKEILGGTPPPSKSTLRSGELVKQAVASVLKTREGITPQKSLWKSSDHSNSFTQEDVEEIICTVLMHIQKDECIDEAHTFLKELASEFFGSEFQRQLESTSDAKACAIIIRNMCQKQGGDYFQLLEKLVDSGTEKGQQILIELAKLDVQQNFRVACSNLKKYRIDDSTPQGQQGLIDILKLAAQRDPNFVAGQISTFGINKKNGQRIFIEIAEFCLQMEANLPLHIHDVPIERNSLEGQAALTRLAILSAQKNGKETSRYFERYGIISPEACLEVAKEAAKQDGEHTSLFIWHYGLRQAEALFEVALAAAQQSGHGVSRYIKNYGIDDRTEEGQQRLIQIAKVAAQQGGVSSYIKNYVIKDQKALIEIAMLAARKNGLGVSSNIGNYGITDHEARYEIFREALLQNYDSLKYIKNYHFEDLIYSNLSFGVDNCQSKVDAVLAVLSEHGLSAKSVEYLKKLAAGVTDNHSLQILQRALFTAVYLNECCKIREIPFAEIASEVDALVTLQNPKLRGQIARILGSHLVKDHGSNERLKEFRKETDVSAGPYVLPAMLLSILQSQKVPGSAEIILQIKSARSESKNPVFKDIKARDVLLSCLCSLASTDSIPPEQKAALLQMALKSTTEVTKPDGSTEKIFSKQDCLLLLRAIANIHYLTKSLETLGTAQTPETIHSQFFAAFQSIVPIPNIDEFTEKFARTFGSFRDPAALYTYAGSVAKLPVSDKQLVLEALAVFVREVLEGQTSQRYSSPHLEKIFSARPDLKEKWMQGASAPLSEQVLKNEQTITAPTSINFEELILRSIREKHAEGADLPFVFDYANATDDKTGEDIRKALGKAKKENPKDPSLLFQDYLLKLMSAKDPAQAALILENCLKNIPPTLPENLQLIKDLEGFRSMLQKSPSQNKANLTIIDTDDPCDLLLCGTEIDGSCQNITGDPQLNKCLVGYLLDGKNRLLAIKDENGMIKGRAILRLLWDGDKPVLFIERIYPELLDDKLKDQLISFAKKRAVDLDLPLVAVEVGEGEPYSKTIHSIDGRVAPYEYVDAVNEVSSTTWSIKQAHILQPSVKA